jgi:prevent-host-death family protein
MDSKVSKSDLKPKLLEYLRLVEIQKRELIVTDRGRPVAKIIPFSKLPAQTLEELAGSVVRYDDPLDPVGEGDWDLLS